MGAVAENTHTHKRSRWLGRRGVGADEGTNVVVVLPQYKMADKLRSMNRLSRHKPLVNLHLKTEFIHSEKKTHLILNFSCLSKHLATKAYQAVVG
jgi:hypothetical protein